MAEYKKKKMYWVKYKELWKGGSVVKQSGYPVLATTEKNAIRLVKKGSKPSHVIKVFDVKARRHNLMEKVS